MQSPFLWQITDHPLSSRCRPIQQRMRSAWNDLSSSWGCAHALLSIGTTVGDKGVGGFDGAARTTVRVAPPRWRACRPPGGEDLGRAPRGGGGRCHGWRRQGGWKGVGPIARVWLIGQRRSGWIIRQGYTFFGYLQSMLSIISWERVKYSTFCSKISKIRSKSW